MRHRWTSHAERWLAALLLTVMGTLLLAAPAQATPQAAAVAGTLTLAITNGTTFQYGDYPGPRFHLVLTLDAPLSGTNPSFTAQIKDDNGYWLNADFRGPAADGITYTADATAATGTAWLIGARTATATLTSPAVSPAITSNQVSFTITKRGMMFSCGMGNLLRPGQATQVTLVGENVDTIVPLDWTQGTATVWLVGPSTMTYANLVPNSSGVVSITTPVQAGWYALNCSFTGTPYYLPQQMTTTNKSILISQMRQLGGVQLYTTPQTLVAGQATQMLVVFKAASGLPTPTGEFNIIMQSTGGVISTRSTMIGPNGTASFTLAPIPTLAGATAITVHYFGDPTYNNRSMNFPMTNPPIPGGGGGSGGSGGSGGGGGAQGNAKATASATGTPGATQTVEATQTATGSSNGVSPATPPANTNGTFWLIGGLVLFRARRAKSVLGAGSDTAIDAPDRGPVPFQW